MADKVFDNVKLNVDFTPATTRANIESGENLSVMLGKVSKWYSSLKSTAWDGNALKVNGFTVGVNVPANAKFTDTTYSNFVKSGSGAKAGLVPAPSTTAGTTKYLREDGTWTVPPNTNTWTALKGATADAAGTAGYAPAPPKEGYNTKYLRADGTWTTPPNTTYSVSTTSANGLMSSADKTKLDGIATGANKYVHPTTSGNKHIPSGGSSGQILRWSADGTAAWGADNNTDTKTLQSSSTTTNYRPILMGYNNNTDTSQLEASVTNQVYQTSKAYIQPSTGNMYTEGYVSIGSYLLCNRGIPDGETYTYLVGHNGTNLWIGAGTTDGKHHIGATCISTGYDKTNKTGYETVRIVVPNDENTNGVSYEALHTGNFKKHINLSTLGAAASTHTHSYLPLSGGTITGKISYNTGTKSSWLFAVDNGDANGSMYTGPHTGGLTVIGSGESPTSIRTAVLSEDGLLVPCSASSKFSQTSETLILSADSDIYFMTNCNTFANRKPVKLSVASEFMPGTTGTGSIGTSTYKWNTMYANTFYGALSGNASSATKVTSTVTDPTTATQYWIPFHDTGGTTGAKSLRHSKTMACHVMKGTATTDGYTYFQVGNTTASGTDGNSYGVLRVCSHDEFYQNILPNTITANTNITLPATSGTLALTSSNITGSSAKWTTARNINGMSVDGSANRINYGKCSTAAATAAKTVACTGFALITGSEITVKFTVTNTAANPTLNVNSTGAKPIYYRGAAISAGYLAANRTYTFRYNGTQYELVGDVNTNTTYSNMKAATASAAGKSGLVPAPAAGKQTSFLRGDGTWQTPTDTKVTVTGIKTNASTNYGIKRPLLFAASNANPSNELSSASDDDVLNGSKAVTYTGGVQMNGGIYIETNYWTTGGTGSYVKLHLPNGGHVVGNLDGNVTGNASSASKLLTSHKINGVSFDGSNDISITKCLYSGTGAAQVTLSESQSNYDLLIIVTNKGTVLHRVGTTYCFHTAASYPAPSQNGTKTVNLYNFSTYDGTDKKISVVTSSVELSGSGTTATAKSTTATTTITEVYGLKLSAT